MWLYQPGSEPKGEGERAGQQISLTAAVSVDSEMEWSGDERQPGEGRSGEQAAASACGPMILP